MLRKLFSHVIKRTAWNASAATSTRLSHRQRGTPSLSQNASVSPQMHARLMLLGASRIDARRNRTLEEVAFDEGFDLAG
jgi:hypothetical protein